MWCLHVCIHILASVGISLGWSSSGGQDLHHFSFPHAALGSCEGHGTRNGPNTFAVRHGAQFVHDHFSLVLPLSESQGKIQYLSPQKEESGERIDIKNHLS